MSILEAYALAMAALGAASVAGGLIYAVVDLLRGDDGEIVWGHRVKPGR